jgi:23S rRNA pseudouridine2457 synthase
MAAETREVGCKQSGGFEGGTVKGNRPKCLSQVAGRQFLDSILTALGLSQSECASYLQDGRVTVNGRRVQDARYLADPFVDDIRIDRRPLARVKACRYLLFNKPYDVLCAFTDPEGRPTLSDFVDVPGVYAAGRLDLDSEGLLLLTDDGWLIHRLGHPRYRHPKVYLAQVERVPDQIALERLRDGVTIKGKRTLPAMVELLSIEPDLPPRPVPIRYRKSVPTAWLRLVLTEGRKRQVRRMTAAVGHPTLRLVRVGIGPLELGTLEPGEWRESSRDELDSLRNMLAGSRGAGNR